MEGEGPTYAVQRTIQPSQYTIHAVQEKILFISQLVYSNNTLVNIMCFFQECTVCIVREKTEATVLVLNLETKLTDPTEDTALSL